MAGTADEIEAALHAAQDSSSVGRRLHAGASLDAAIPADADRLTLLVEYSLTMVAGLCEALRTVAFEIDELEAEHHRLAAVVERLSNEVDELRQGRQ